MAYQFVEKLGGSRRPPLSTVESMRLGLALALLMTACAPADPPAKPSFATDVLPVMEAHCTRCHGGNGLLLDPGGTPSNPIFKGPPLDGYFTQYGDMPGCPTMRQGPGALGCQG